MSIRERDAGFTLAEVLIAMFILAVALMAMGKMQTRAIEAGEFSGRMSVGLRMAQDVMEQFQRDLPGVLPAVGTQTQTCSSAGGAAVGTVTCPVLADPEGRLGAFTRTWIVTTGSIAGTAVTQVAVTVTWGAGKHVNLNSLLTQ